MEGLQISRNTVAIAAAAGVVLAGIVGMVWANNTNTNECEGGACKLNVSVKTDPCSPKNVVTVTLQATERRDVSGVKISVGDKTQDNINVTKSSTKDVTFADVAPGEYDVRVIESNSQTDEAQKVKVEKCATANNTSTQGATQRANGSDGTRADGLPQSGPSVIAQLIIASATGGLAYFVNRRFN